MKKEKGSKYSQAYGVVGKDYAEFLDDITGVDQLTKDRWKGIEDPELFEAYSQVEERVGEIAQRYKEIFPNHDKPIHLWVQSLISEEMDKLGVASSRNCLSPGSKRIEKLTILKIREKQKYLSLGMF